MTHWCPRPSFFDWRTWQWKQWRQTYVKLILRGRLQFRWIIKLHSTLLLVCLQRLATSSQQCHSGHAKSWTDIARSLTNMANIQFTSMKCIQFNCSISRALRHWSVNIHTTESIRTFNIGVTEVKLWWWCVVLALSVI